jgi:hypothetical protein
MRLASLIQNRSASPGLCGGCQGGRPPVASTGPCERPVPVRIGENHDENLNNAEPS